jgi:regulator of protease activity HflC (stomatin/prohibitin superfamily)
VGNGTQALLLYAAMDVKARIKYSLNDFRGKKGFWSKIVDRIKPPSSGDFRGVVRAHLRSPDHDLERAIEEEINSFLSEFLSKTVSTVFTTEKNTEENSRAAQDFLNRTQDEDIYQYFGLQMQNERLVLADPTNSKGRALIGKMDYLGVDLVQITIRNANLPEEIANATRQQLQFEADFREKEMELQIQKKTAETEKAIQGIRDETLKKQMLALTEGAKAAANAGDVRSEDLMEIYAKLPAVAKAIQGSTLFLDASQGFEASFMKLLQKIRP